jgi:ribosome-interacting GTPase 1
MPANLTPEYEKAELRYRQATSDDERLAALQAMLSAIPKHKGTEKMQADIKRRISQLRREEQKAAHGKGPDPFHIPRSGAGQVVLVGPPNTGKSSLLAATTHAGVKVAEYPFTTVVPQPGMWHKDDVQIELVDTPPFSADHVPTGLMGTIHNADVVCVVVEATEAALDQADMALGVLRARGLALRSAPRNQLPAEASCQRSGLIVATKADLAPPGAIEVLRELYAGGGAQGRDSAGAEPSDALHSGDGLEVVAVSARTRQGLDDWFKRLWDLLAIIRVYSKEPGRPPDLHKPFVVPAGATVADLARQIHRDLPERMKFARLWGHSRFEGQQVHKTELLRDRDVVEIHE